MKAGGGKAKGAEFERSICKSLSKWITDDKRTDIFWRSAMSGGRSTVLKKKGEEASAHSGDISCTHWLGSSLIELFSIECKAYKDIGLAPSLAKRKGLLLEFWKQTCHDAEQYGKRPMLIAKQSRYPVLLCLDPRGCDILNLRESPLLIPLGSMYPIHLKNMFIYDFEEFIENTDPAVLEVAGYAQAKRRVQLSKKEL